MRDLVQNDPFKPFRLHLADGKSLRVPHPDFVLVGSELLVVATELPKCIPGGINLIPYENIARVEMLPRRIPKSGLIESRWTIRLAFP